MDSGKEVTKEEFDQFIKGYPNRLEVDVNQIFYPPIISYNDFSRGNWPRSVVAWCKEEDGERTQFHVESDL